MADDFGINSTGMAEKVTKKPKKKQAYFEDNSKVEEPTPPPGRVDPPNQEQKPGFFSKIASVFKRKPAAAPVQQQAQPKPQASTKNLKWVVPKNVRAVYVRVYDENGKVKNTYNISNFITLRSGYTIELNAE